MDPFARKMWRFGFGFAGLMLLLFAVLTAFYVHKWPKCPDRRVAETDNPDHKWVAAILERRCGPESPFITRVNLRPAGPLQRGFFSGEVNSGTVFVIEQDAQGAAITLLWPANNALIIRCAHCNPAFIRRSDQHWGAVSIHYELP